ncbi:hypothetical protein [uncultured phage MedDCM-OCT-S01-C58]|nr:hypothetical protein [uncultured phage MedDCM-OCT-S01-C58]BAR24303.1 hypothetical protein [uncultured Mediterranean phage uvMED]
MSVIGSNVLAGASGQSAGGGGGGGGGAAMSRSLRFERADSAYLSRTFSASNRKTWTFSCWAKLSEVGTNREFFVTQGTSPWLTIQVAYNDKFYVSWTAGGPGTAWQSDALFREISAWYHFVVAFDTTQGTASNRLKVYANGVQLTGNSSYPSQNTDYQVNSAVAHGIGGNKDNYSGYLADVHFIDGQALAPTDFGETNTDNLWVPKAYAGTYGTNGFHLDFADNSSNAALGTDTSGNSNTWTVNNLNAVAGAAANQSQTWSSSNTGYHAGATGAFNGNLTNTSFATGGANANAYVDITAITASKVEVYINAYGSGSAGAYYYCRQTNNTQHTYTISSSGTSLGWITVYDGSQISINRLGGARNSSGAAGSAQYGWRVDGVLLVDAGISGFATASDIDSLLDTPTNGDTASDTGAGGEITGNYATFNPLDRQSTNGTLSNGNLDLTSTGANWAMYRSTMFVSSGKWYWECTLGNNQYSTPGICTDVYQMAASSGNWVNGSTEMYGLYIYNGKKYNGDAGVAYATADTTAAGSVIGLALDLDNGTLTFYKDGASLGTAYSGLTGKNISPTHWVYQHSGVGNADVYNFGQRAFSYPVSGYKSLNTANLSSTIADGSLYFDAKLYTGNGSTQSISGLNYSPDLVWVKRRDGGSSHFLYDTVRGFSNGNAYELRSDGTNAEGVPGAANTGLTAFNSDGFSLGSDGGANGNNDSFVSWAWNAGSSTVSNTDGDITSQVRASTASGFSIVKYTGVGGIPKSIGHGLNSVPGLILLKRRDAVDDWPTYFLSHTYFTLNTTDNTSNNDQFFHGDYKPTSTLFTIGGNGAVNASGGTYIAYCFASVEGYSKISTFQGNGSTDGTFVYTGFKPRFVLIKGFRSSNWGIWDTARDSFNVSGKRLQPQATSAEGSGDANLYIDILSNGFKLKNTDHDSNESGTYYAYYAVAEHPFASNGGLAR